MRRARCSCMVLVPGVAFHGRWDDNRRGAVHRMMPRLHVTAKPTTEQVPVSSTPADRANGGWSGVGQRDQPSRRRSRIRGR